MSLAEATQLTFLKMSYQRKSFWMPLDAGCFTDAEVGYDSSSRINPKRSQWFMDSSEPELFNNKKQAMKAFDGRPVPGIPNINISSWNNTSSFQSVPVQFNDCLFGLEPLRSVDLVDRNIHTVGSETMHTQRKEFDSQYGSNQSVGLSMSHNNNEDPSSCHNFGAIEKVKVNQVNDSDTMLSAPIGNSYNRGENGAISVSATYNKGDGKTISLGPTYNNCGGGNTSLMGGASFTKAKDNFISMGHSFNKEDGNFISMGHNYTKGDTTILSMGHPYNKGKNSFMSMSQSYEKADGNSVSLGTLYNKPHESFISIGATYGKANDDFISMAPLYAKGDGKFLSMGSSHGKADSNVVAIGRGYDKGESCNLFAEQNYNKAEANTISFGGFHEEIEPNPSGGIISSYDLLMTAPQSLQASRKRHPIKTNMDSNVDAVATDTILKNKEPKTAKKAPPNNFPSNVKSLLSTGIFDGVPVKYVSWSRDKNLKGIIKGTGYLCSCKDCNHPKVFFQGRSLIHGRADEELICIKQALNAYEFERHACCKTKHPNNHIYFENGKTIYAVVQELKNTPQELLFDAIQNVTGSPIHQKNFCIWRESYQAATRELQRIYGKDEVFFQGRSLIHGRADEELICIKQALNAYEFERHACCKTKHPNNHIYFENGKTIYAVVQELKNTPQELLFDAIQNVTGSPIHQKNFCIWRESYQAATRELQRIYGKDEVSMPS